MLDTGILSMIVKQLSTINGLIFLIFGLFSLYFNVSDARRKNHKRAEITARLGGWFYVIIGFALIVKKIF